MKKLLISSFALLWGIANAQFTVIVESPNDYLAKEAILYTLNGSKDIISSKEIRKGSTWKFSVPSRYVGMMKVYFPDTNEAFSLISENKNIDIKLDLKSGKLGEVQYLDPSNKMMEEVQDLQKKKELIFPALLQISEYYKPSSEFGTALNKEIVNLEKKFIANPQQYPFVSYYDTNYNKFLVKSAGAKEPSEAEVVDYIAKTSDMLETSSLLRPILISYLTNAGGAKADAAVEQLLKAVNVETPRGQVVLSELIEIFDGYGMEDLKRKYLTQAQNLKCTIFDRLAGTLKANKNVEMGSKLPDYAFRNPSKTTAKNLYSVKADKKVIVFWSSTCSHCEAELPVLLQKYNQMKANKVEVVGLSLDTEEQAYQAKVNALPWINDSELRGWNSSYVETYNVHATPTYFVLDADNRIIAKPDHAKDVLDFLKI